MRKTIALGVLIVAGTLVGAAGSALAKTTPEQKCASAKQKAAGKEIAAALGCYGKGIPKGLPVDQACLSKARGKYDAAFTKAGAACIGDGTAVHGQIDGCVSDVLIAADGIGKCPAAKVKAAGKKAAAKLGCSAKVAGGSNKPGVYDACILKAETKFAAAVTKADAKGVCDGTAAGLESIVDGTCFNPVANQLPPVAPGCGNGITEAGETCDDGNTVDGDSCPSSCVIQTCSPTASTRTFTVSFAGGVNVAAVQVLLDYPEGKISIPGSGSDSNVTGSITNTPPGALLVSNDLDYALIQSVTSLSALTAGPIFTVHFNDCSGATVPTAADFTCTVTDAADTSFNTVTGVTCSVSAP